MKYWYQIDKHPAVYQFDEESHYGIWKVEALNLEDITDSSLVRIQHPTRGSQPDIISFFLQLDIEAERIL